MSTQSSLSRCSARASLTKRICTAPSTFLHNRGAFDGGSRCFGFPPRWCGEPQVSSRGTGRPAVSRRSALCSCLMWTNMHTRQFRLLRHVWRDAEARVETCCPFGCLVCLRHVRSECSRVCPVQDDEPVLTHARHLVRAHLSHTHGHAYANAYLRMCAQTHPYSHRDALGILGYKTHDMQEFARGLMGSTESDDGKFAPCLRQR